LDHRCPCIIELIEIHDSGDHLNANHTPQAPRPWSCLSRDRTHGRSKIVAAALKGATHQELSFELGISVPAVKKRWRSIYIEVEDHMPELFANYTAAEDGKRGPQRRHTVLAYMRDHPAELRPFARSKF
jgi:hypothetical protein